MRNSMSSNQRCSRNDGPWSLARVPIILGTPKPSDVTVLNKHVFRSANGQAASLMEKRENV
jgi:hypothetical protein